MNKSNTEKEKKTVFIRSDGWVISEEGMQRLTKAGHMGHDRFMESIRSQIGDWHRVSKPLDRDAASIVKGVKGMVARAMFVSTAIVKAAEEKANKEIKKNG